MLSCFVNWILTVVVLVPILLLSLGSAANAADFPAADVFEMTSPSVVLIVAKGEGSSSGMQGAGSFVVAPNLVLTNAHVILDKETGRPQTTIFAYLCPPPATLTRDPRKDLRTKISARVKAFDAELDLALLELSGVDRNVPILEFSNPASIRIGEEVAAIGHPEQGGLWSLTAGRISGAMADQGGVVGKDVYQTDTSVNRGNSGGPLLDRNGRMVGVNTNIARVGAGNIPITGVNFAVQSAVAKLWMEKVGVRVSFGQNFVATPVQNTPALKVEAKSPQPPPPASMPSTATAPTVEAKPVQSKPVPSPPVEVKSNQTSPPPPTPVPNSDRILTPKRPYKFDDLMAATEAEMEDMMGEMRGGFGK